jgi:hypothetical protein
MSILGISDTSSAFQFPSPRAQSAWWGGVRGGGRDVFRILDGFKDSGHHGLGIFEHVMIPEAQYPIAVSFQIPCTRGVCDHSIMLGMPSSVDFDDQSPLVASKIREVTAYRRLTTEMGAVNAQAPRMPPESFFRLGHSVAQRTSARHARVFLALLRPLLDITPHP